MAWIWGKIHTRFASRGKGIGKEVLVYPIGSFGEIFDVLTEKIREQGSEVHISASVDRIGVEEGRVTGMEVRLNGREPEFMEYDAVIATTPSYVFPKLVPPLPDGYLARLTDVNYMAAVLLILVLDRPLSHMYWLNVADRSIPFVGVIEQTNLIPPEHYDGKHVVYPVELPGHRPRAVWARPRRAAREVPAPPAEDQPRVRPVVDRNQLSSPGRRGTADHRRQLHRPDARPPDAV